MKGIVFVELANFVERHAGTDLLEDVLAEVDPDSGGAYTSVGNYSHQEAVDLVLAVSRRLDIPAPDLMRQFGRELAGRFVEIYPGFFEGVDSAREFLRGIHDHIHVEVRKLYPDSNPPGFVVSETDTTMTLDYTSHRPMAMVALGLIEGAVAHFGDNVVIRTEPESLAYESSARFVLEQQG